MARKEKFYNFENVNGFMLTLKYDNSEKSPNSRVFTVSYKNKENNRTWPKISLFFAIVFNILALSYIRISMTAFLIIVIVMSFLIFFWITHSVQSESILVIPTVGIQSSIKYVCGKEDTFISWSSIDDIIINEVIKMNRVLYFLTLLVKSNASLESDATSTKLIPLFKFTKPRLAMLEIIYSELQVLLSQTRLDRGSGDAKIEP